MNKQENKKYSNLKAMLAITKGSLISIIRNPSSIVFSLIFPFIFIIVFGFIGGGGFNVGVGVMKDSDKNNPIYERLQKIDNIRLITNISDEEMMSRLEKGKLDVLLNITKSTDGKTPLYNVVVKSNKASPERSNIFKLILNSIVDKSNLAMIESQMPLNSKLAEVKEEIVEGRVYKTIDFILPGQLGFAILGAGVFGTAFVFLSLRETLVIKRFFATPINRRFIVIGEGISRLIFSLSTSVIIILVGYFLFGFTLVNGFATFINMLVISALGLIVFLGFGFLVSNIASSINVVPPLANLITLPQFLLAGTFFSIETFPAWLQPISRAIPLTYVNEALRKIAFEGATIFSLPTEILVLSGWGIVIYALAIKFFKWE
jgi:ABC-2 type transport system permease protein